MMDNIKDIHDNFSRSANDEVTAIVTEKTARRKLLEMNNRFSCIYTENEEEGDSSNEDVDSTVEQANST